METATPTQHYRDMAARSARTRRLKSVEQRIRDLVDSAPPLTAEQRDRLVALLRPQDAA